MGQGIKMRSGHLVRYICRADDVSLSKICEPQFDFLSCSLSEISQQLLD